MNHQTTEEVPEKTSGMINWPGGTYLIHGGHQTKYLMAVPISQGLMLPLSSSQAAERLWEAAEA